MNNELTPDQDAREADLKARLESCKKYGYYYDVLGPEERKYYLLAQTDPGLEAYIDVFRKAIERAAPRRAADFKLINDSLKTLKRMEALNVKIRKEYPLPQRPSGQPES